MKFITMPAKEWNATVLESGSLAKAKELLDKLSKNEEETYLEGMMLPDFWHGFMKRLASIETGLRAKSNRIARRGHRRGMPLRAGVNYFVAVSYGAAHGDSRAKIRLVEALPDFMRVEHVKTIEEILLNPGGYLEQHNGELCLRCADSCEMITGGGFMLTKRWARGAFNPDLYPVKQS